MRKVRWLTVFATFVLFLVACGASQVDETTTQPQPVDEATTQPQAETTVTSQAPSATDPPVTTEPAEQSEGRSVEAVVASITVDGDASDWDSIAGLDMVLEPIEGEGVTPHDASVKVAHDDEFLYVLMTIDDDYDWVADQLHLTGAPSVMWAIESEAGPHMGTDAEDGEGPSMGMVDIWHWELQCALGESQGGAVSSVDEVAPGNDPACNFDDEFATDPEERYDDGDTEGPEGTGAENSLLGVFTHSNPVDSGDGTWTFEMRRPLQTGDSQDAQFTVGGSALMAVAYWDADNSPEGWDDPEHVQSSNQGWIEVLISG